MYGFQLGREFKLSLAEIHSLFPTHEILYNDRRIAIVDIDDREQVLEKAQRMWGVIKIIELKKIPDNTLENALWERARNHEWKFHYGVSLFWDARTTDLKKLLTESKKYLKKSWLSTRFINKWSQNLTSAQIIWEKLKDKWTDFSLIETRSQTYFWHTIWVQDIDSYSKRDYGKTRDMQVGMLPPKLAQIMINIASRSSWDWNDSIIYDPFSWLGTVLMESLLMGNSQTFGSDISEKNISKTQKSLEFLSHQYHIDISNTQLQVLDAREIASSSFLSNKNVSIVTEWYLGKIFHKNSISKDKIISVQEELVDIYNAFFAGLKKSSFTWNIVISFPFWEIDGKYFYFDKIYGIIKLYTKVLPLLPNNIQEKTTKYGSLLYKRKNQIVGREIFALQI